MLGAGGRARERGRKEGGGGAHCGVVGAPERHNGRLQEQLRCGDGRGCRSGGNEGGKEKNVIACTNRVARLYQGTRSPSFHSRLLALPCDGAPAVPRVLGAYSSRARVHRERVACLLRPLLLLGEGVVLPIPFHVQPC